MNNAQRHCEEEAQRSKRLTKQSRSSCARTLFTLQTDGIAAPACRQAGSLTVARNDVWVVVVCALFAFSLCAHAKGIIPPKSEPAQATEPASPYLVIGNPVPPSLTVTDANGKTRTLLSYKVSTEALVVCFYSPRCVQNQQQWSPLKRFYEAYKGWHTGFIGVSINPDESLDELAQAMSKAGLPYAAVRDDQGRVARALHATVTPEILIIDEFNQLRYRGPLKYATNAINAIIGQEDMRGNAEPADLDGCPIQ